MKWCQPKGKTTAAKTTITTTTTKHHYITTTTTTTTTKIKANNKTIFQYFRWQTEWELKAPFVFIILIVFGVYSFLMAWWLHSSASLFWIWCQLYIKCDTQGITIMKRVLLFEIIVRMQARREPERDGKKMEIHIFQVHGWIVRALFGFDFVSKRALCVSWYDRRH